MLFVTPELARRIEANEVDMLRVATQHAAQRDPTLPILDLPVAGGVATFAELGSPLNKLFGLGFADALPSDEELERIETHAFAQGEAVRAEVSSLADPALVELLSRRGYVLLGFENVLGLALPAADLPARAPEFALHESPEHELDTWLDVVVEGFATPDLEGVGPDELHDRTLLRRVIRDFNQVPGMTRYLARRDGVPAGGGTMRMAKGIALMCGAATLPAHRRRGIQTAMLAERLAIATRAGCELALVTTQGGSKSMQNAQRRGFELLYVRAVMCRAPPPG
jgi:GNAT superfamily N-acetyltransferase